MLVALLGLLLWHYSPRDVGDYLLSVQFAALLVGLGAWMAEVMARSGKDVAS